MNTTQHTIALQYGGVMLAQGSEPNGLAATIQYELMQAGYMLDSEAYRCVEHAPRQEAVRFHHEVIEYLRTMLGDTGNFKPFYEGFPQEVMELSHAELFINQLLYYWSNCTFMPEAWKGERPQAFEHPHYTMLRCITQAEFESFFTTLCASSQSLTAQSRNNILWYVHNYPGVETLLPKQVPFKETMCMLAAEGMPIRLATATDVLRLAVYMSGGDISLPPVPPSYHIINCNGVDRKFENKAARKFRFKKFSRAERRMLLAHLEQSSCDASEMVLRAERWKRLGEILHVGEYARRYPRSAEALCAVRNYARSWYAQVDACESLNERLDILSQRPGELLRRIDCMVREAESDSEVNTIFEAYTQALPHASSKVLYELYNHFLRRRQEDVVRPILLKHKRTPLFLESNDAFDEALSNRLIAPIEAELKRRYSTMETLGKVYIDERLKAVPAPMQMRGLNPALKTLIRGTRVPLNNPDARVVRFYLHWIDPHGHEDLDLSATFVGDNNIETISWATGLKNECAIHSGDVRHRKGDCAEYIDVILEEARKEFRYVVITANNFERRPMNSLDAAFGYMEREHPEANATWMPETTANSFRFSSEAQGVHMVILDLEKMEYIVLDIDSQSLPVAYLDTALMTLLIRLYTDTPALDMYTLLQWHAMMRGTLVDTANEADTVMDYENFTTQYTECLKYLV
ncbi:MAG: hypothetical protein IKY75_08530 [Bacteroidaceae bacterium]|nr:hypothetical protein [Bacteroidaceae bacterium]